MKTTWDKLKNWIDDKKDLIWAIGIVIASYFLMGFLQDLIGIGGVDFVVFLKPIYAAVCLFVGSAAIWLLLKISWKTIAKYYSFNEYFEDFKQLTTWQRILIGTFVWSFYLFLFVLIVLGGMGTWMN